MFWSVLIPHLTVSAVFVGLLLRALWRYERTVDRLLAESEENFAARMRKFDEARDDIRASLRKQADAAIAEMLSGIKISAAAGEAHLSFDTVAVSSSIGGTGSAGTVGQVPDRDEIESLPRWARVALAARCARRVRPLVEHFWPDAPGDYLQYVAKAVHLAERAAAAAAGIKFFGTVHAAPPAAAAAAAAAAHAASAASARDGDRVAFTIGCSDAGDSTSDDEDFAAPAAAFRAGRAASFAAAHAYAGTNNAARSAFDTFIRRDFEAVRGLALANGWIDDTAVPPSVFGPLWPDGPPKDWPEPEQSTTELVFEVDVPDDMTTAKAVEIAKELSAALCELDFAGGGHGLAIQPPVDLTIPARARVPV